MASAGRDHACRRPASSNTVAVVFRQAWKVIHASKLCRSRASTSQRVTVRGSRKVPSPCQRQADPRLRRPHAACPARSRTTPEAARSARPGFVRFRTMPPVILIKFDASRSTPRSRSTPLHNTANASRSADQSPAETPTDRTSPAAVRPDHPLKPGTVEHAPPQTTLEAHARGRADSRPSSRVGFAATTRMPKVVGWRRRRDHRKSSLTPARVKHQQSLAGLIEVAGTGRRPCSRPELPT